MTHALILRALSNESEIEALAADWQALQSRANTSFFSGPDWLRLWWETVGKRKNRTLRVIVATRDGKLAGVLPLMIEKRMGCRILEWAGNELFDYCSSLAEDDGVAKELWEAARQSSCYDFALIRDVRPASRDYGILSAFAKRTDHNRAPYMALTWPTLDAWLKSRTRKQRRAFKYKTVRLEQRGAITFEIIQDGPIPKEIIDTMLRSKMAWFIKQGKTGVFSNPRIKEAFHRMAELAAKEGKLFLGTLKCDETPVSHIFNFIDNGIMHGYLTSYDSAWAPCSPGTLIVLRTLGWAIDNGLKECDFMRGTESYKLHYATEIRDLPNFSFAGTAWGRCNLMIYGLAFACGKEMKELAKRRLPSWAQKTLRALRPLRKSATESPSP